MRLSLALVLVAGTVNAQAVELRSARLVLSTGEGREVDGGVWVPAPEFAAYVRACSACQRDQEQAPTPQVTTPAGYLWALGVGLLVGFAGAVALWVALRAP